jgi:hypothetical protein
MKNGGREIQAQHPWAHGEQPPGQPFCRDEQFSLLITSFEFIMQPVKVLTACTSSTSSSICRSADRAKCAALDQSEVASNCMHWSSQF